MVVWIHPISNHFWNFRVKNTSPSFQTNVPEPFKPKVEEQLKEGLPVGLSDAQVTMMMMRRRTAMVLIMIIMLMMMSMMVRMKTMMMRI